MGHITPSNSQLRLPEPLLGLIRRCERNCVAGCCGVDAYDLNPEHMLPWVAENGIGRVWEALDQLSGVIREVDESHLEVMSDEYEFNHRWDSAAECVQYLKQWQWVIKQAIQTTTGRPVAVDPSWLTSTVTALARGIYADRAFDRLPILADALQDAGCDNDDVLTHCRGAGPHARGCWVVDLLLGRS